MPRPLAVGFVLVVATAVVAGVLALLVPAFVNQLPALTQSLTDAAARLERLLRRLPFVPDPTTLGDLAPTELPSGTSRTTRGAQCRSVVRRRGT